MELTKTYSRTGKTMYHAIQLDENTIIKAQSKVKAVGIIANLKVDSIVNLQKAKRNWFLTIDEVSFGRLTKTDFIKLQKYTQVKNYENSHNENQLQNSSSSQDYQVPYQSQLSVFSGNGSSVRREQEILPDGFELRYRGVKFIHQSSDLVYSSDSGLAYLDWIDSQIQKDESSDNELTRSCAKIEREQLRIAASQRQLGNDQRQLGNDQRNTASRILSFGSKYLPADSIARLTQIASN
jgi:hypothetical protein